MSKSKISQKTIIMIVTTFTLIVCMQNFVFAYSLAGPKWPSSSIAYTVNVPVSYSSEVTDAAYWWSSLTDANLYSSSSANVSVVASDYGYTSWDGQTSRSYTTNWLGTQTYTSATQKLNRYFTDSYDMNNPLRLKLVIAHEFGHVLGLNHVGGYHMMYGSDVWVAYQNNMSLGVNGPTYDDFNGVNALY